MRRMMMGVLAGGLVLGVGIGVWGQQAATRPTAAKLPFTISKETTAITGPLRADGTVDYVAALNEKYGKGVTPENNGFVLWLKVVGTGDDVIPQKIKPAFLKLCGAQEAPAGAEVWVSYADYLKKAKGLDGDALSAATDELSDTWRATWKAEGHPDVAAYLKKQDALMGIVAQAADRPKWWSPSVASDGRTAISVLLPSLGLIRDAGNALCARATLRAGSGDVDGFLADIGTIRKLARQVASSSTTIERLVGIALEARAVKSVAAVAASGKLTEAQCNSLLVAFDHFSPMPSVVESPDVGERWMNLDVIAVVASGHVTLLESKDAQNIGKIFGTINREAVDWNLVLKEVNGFFDEEVKAMRRADFAQMRSGLTALDQTAAKWQSEAKAIKGGTDFSRNAGEERTAYSQRAARDIMSILTPSIEKSAELERSYGIVTSMTRVVIAAATLNAKNGKWPARVEELVPAVLKELPKDIYSAGGNSAIKYRVRPIGVQVYAVGSDAKDDGGINDRAKGMDDIAVGVSE